MLGCELAEARAEQLLVAHLSPRQRAEYAAAGRVTIVKRGIVWGIVLRDLAKVAPLVALLAIPGWRIVAATLVATFLVALAPLWLPRFAVASARRREWVVSARTSPVVRARGRETRFCAAFREHLPPGDRLLAWKHVIELSEGHFLRTANIRGRRRVTVADRAPEPVSRRPPPACA